MRIGLVDIGAAGVVIALLLLPEPVRPLEDTYTGPQARWLPRIAEAQAEVARRPESGEAAAVLAEVLMWSGQTDWALRAAGAAGSAKSPDRWRALWALSKVHAARIEVDASLRWARQARQACDEPGTTCTWRDKEFLDIRVASLSACVDAGIDPKIDPKGCEEAVMRVFRKVNAPPVPREAPKTPQPDPGTPPQAPVPEQQAPAPPTPQPDPGPK